MRVVKSWAIALLAWALVIFEVLAQHGHGHGSHVHLHHRQHLIDSMGTDRALDAPPDAIAKARTLVKDAIAKAAVHNKARLDNPSRNQYKLKPGTKIRNRRDQPPDTQPARPLFNVTKEIADAAALLAEYDAAAELNATGTVKRDYSHIDVLHGRQQKGKRAGTWWMGNKEHRGSWPWGKDSSYQLSAINNAMKAGNRCGAKCNGSTTKQAILYFPPGTYLVSGTIEIFFGTQMIGDATNWPVIKAAASFVGLGVFSTDHYVENGGTGPDGNALEWYINTANFYRQIRNFKFDIRLTDPNAYVCALHYQVDQATSLSNVDFIAAAAPTTQQAIYAENGSGGHMSDLTFTGGNFGICEYLSQRCKRNGRLSFRNVNTAVQLIWDWGWTWKSISVSGGQTGFKLLSEDGFHHTGSLMVIDSVFEGTKTAILTFPATTDIKKGTTGITLDNIVFKNVGVAVADNAGKTYLKGGTTAVNTWTLGPVYLDPTRREFTLDKSMDTPRIEELLANNSITFLQNPYFERKKPQYEQYPWSKFISVKAQGAKGDGSTDDTATLQRIINGAGSSIVYFDAGTYILRDTLTIPVKTLIVGEAWAQLVAEGPKFSDPECMDNIVGNKGDKGGVEIQDILVSTKGATAGAVLIEWNIKAHVAGAAGMWDTHVRIGGAAGTDLESAQCPASKTGVSQGCNAASLMMHITENASAYLENIWLWVADHDIDDPLLEDAKNDMIQVQCSVNVARGLLVESTAPTWLYRTSSEHAVYYQYNFYKARNVFAGMIQTESPYYQLTPHPPAPFQKAVGKFPGDPDYACASPATLGCDSSWAVRIVNSKDIFIAGAGLYSWFDTYDQSVCVDASNCQKVLAEIKDNYGGIRIHNLITIGATNMMVSDGTLIASKDNLNVDYHPYWSQVTVFDPKSFDEPPHKICTPGSDSNPARPAKASGAYPPQAWSKANPYQGYFVLVNGSPYKWKVVYQHAYQMDTWQWYDVPAGESLQIEYQFKDDETRVDDKGEVKYEIEGTNKTFQVWARVEESDPRNNVLHLRVQYDNLNTQDKPEGGSLELPQRVGEGGGHRSIPWVLTGSESYGYWSSASPPIGWMGSIMDVIGPRKLKHVCMPGSHDAGMYKLDGKTTGANEGNTLTQSLNFYNQLRRGSRYFDVRPVVANADGDYYCGHYSPVARLMQGGNGERLSELVKQTNQFMRENPHEVVIYYLSHDMDINHARGPPRDGAYTPFTLRQWNEVFDIFAKLNNKCPRLDGDLTDMTINELKGCVLVIVEAKAGRQNEGIYPADPHFSRHDGYSSTIDLRIMNGEQLADMRKGRDIREGSGKEQFWVLSWTLTPNSGTITSIGTIELATSYSYDSIFWNAYYEFTPFSFPNVLYMDAIGFAEGVASKDQDVLWKGSNGELTAMAMAVNLAIVSKNCYVGGGSIWPGEGLSH
ncbi:hypothetical protein CNMCM7691_005696 [Aspergillus felis]|uniref:Rhamnogalacturonase A/B/Epimerase-like pectate lyase domain-containing protein n=1 Tax=Aspergillus felis TaxID=1287682 RepID=A0A8H6QQV0_9EURO|nr:hypothetical protein CNMCM7691_005696 [Aspergillus felis]